jgi:mannose/cellobiose epimerase-like protein (N-acyl-D-glucosamine 2-epimerase family)/dTDP-glucose pyrophosphorylase
MRAMRQAVILVGGRGTRLGALARDLPKPMMPIEDGKPFLDYAIENFARCGVTDVVLLAGHLAQIVRERYDGATVAGAKVSVIVEPAPAGTAGALRYAAGRLDDAFFMANGDTLIDMDYRALEAALGPEDAGALALRRMPDGSRYGRVEIEGSRITAFREKDASYRGEALISAGVYCLRRSVIDLIETTPCSIETQVFPHLAADGVLRGVESKGYFLDIGLPETLAEGRVTVPAMFGRRALDLAAKLKAQATKARAWLFDSALPLWWERGYDRATACFHESLNHDGTAPQTQRRMRVQARQTVVYARAGALGWDGPWREAVEAGVNVLITRAIRDDGGVRRMLGPDGLPADDRRDLYDLAFVIFGLAEVGRALCRGDLVARAGDLLTWADRNWAHADGGYREGEIAPSRGRRQNPHMHMFEAMLSLHEASGQRKHLDAADALAQLIQNKFFDAERGALLETFDDPAAPGIVEPGHEFEWSWLLHSYAALGGRDHSELAERLRAHAERFGVDSARRAAYSEIYPEGGARTETSRLWPNTERLRANLVRYERSRDPAAGTAATEAFDTIMRFCDTPMRGLWRDKLRADNSFAEEPAPASSFYHLIFAMSELIRVAETLE